MAADVLGMDVVFSYKWSQFHSMVTGKQVFPRSANHQHLEMVVRSFSKL